MPFAPAPPIDYHSLLTQRPVTASAPCRVDMGGTLDISTFHYPLRALDPLTFNIALDLRTTVHLEPYRRGWVHITSTGFPEAVHRVQELPFAHPMGLIFTVAAYFGVDGVRIGIQSASPPRSALGGSSVAAVALVAALDRVRTSAGVTALSVARTAWIAHVLEQSVAGVPCGFQDQLAAAFGGVNAWHWTGEAGESPYHQEALTMEREFESLERRMLLAYCGEPHVSRDINGRWVRRFLAGQDRPQWREIIALTHKFVDSWSVGKVKDACQAMNQETAIRRRMTPDVLDEMGVALVESAAAHQCAARFCGAGGGGCIWALGAPGAIAGLRSSWGQILAQREAACLLPVAIARQGVC